MDVFFEHSKIYMHILEYVIGVIIFLNVITVFLFPDGMYANIRGDEGNWILGYYNVHIFIILPWLIIFFICSIKRNGKLKWSAILVGVICLIGIFVAGSKTSSIALLVFLVAIIISVKIGKISLPGVAVVFVVSMSISYLIVILQIQTYFADFIQNTLHRDLTFTGRTVIWDAALEAFFDSPILGNGMLVYMPASSDWTTTQAHNAFLNILANGGIIGLALFVLMFALVAQKMFQIGKHSYKEVIYGGMIAYGIVFITEMPSLQHMLVMILYLGYHLDEIIAEMPMKKQKMITLKFRR
ncbi:MAG: O-antigen ligase family protein [Lachnospirales bacterium]